MVIRPRELAGVDSPVEIGLITPDDVGAAVKILADAFAAPVDLFDWFCRVIWALDGASWYVARVGGEVVSEGEASHATPFPGRAVADRTSVGAAGLERSRLFAHKPLPLPARGSPT